MALRPEACGSSTVFGRRTATWLLSGIPEPAGLERERVGVEVAPAAGRGRSERRQARTEDRAHGAGEGERDRAVGIELDAGGGLDERLRSRTGREPAQPRGLGRSLPDTRRSGDRDASRPLVCRRGHADVDRPARLCEPQSALVTVHAQHDLPHRRAEPRDDRLALVELEPATAQACARRAQDTPRGRGAADEPARPARATNRHLDREPLADPKLLPGPEAAVPDGDGDSASVGPADDHLRDMSRVARLDDAGQGLGVRLDARVGPPEQGCSGSERARGEHEAGDCEDRAAHVTFCGACV